jgi:membrane fusion protein (multidrug efflux system)
MISRRYVAASLVLSAIIGCQKSGVAKANEVGDTIGDTTVSESHSLPVVSVGTAVVMPHVFSPTIRAIGAVSPSPSGYAELSAPGPTRVAHVYVAPGDVVRMGSPIVSFEKATLLATAQSTSTARHTAQATYDRAVRLSQIGILPRKAVDQAAAELAQAEAANIAAQRANELSTLRAPFDGVVTRVSVVQGTAIDANAVLAAVTDPTKLNVVVALSPDDAARVRRGARVTLRGGGTPDAPLIGDGMVAGIGAILDSTTHAVPVRITLRHTVRPLRVGETVTSDIAISTATPVLTVPIAALVPAGDSMTVFVVDRGVAHAHTVTVGTRTDTTAEILSGLTAGQTVVTTGAFGVQDGSRVTVAHP